MRRRGKASFDHALPSAILGAATHLFIACSAATVYWLASRKLRFLVRRAIRCGMLYGIALSPAGPAA